MAKGGWVASRLADEDREVKTCITIKTKSGEVKREVLIVDNVLGVNKQFYVAATSTLVTLATINSMDDMPTKQFDDICLTNLAGVEHLENKIRRRLKKCNLKKR